MKFFVKGYAVKIHKKTNDQNQRKATKSDNCEYSPIIVAKLYLSSNEQARPTRQDPSWPLGR